LGAGGRPRSRAGVDQTAVARKTRSALLNRKTIREDMPEMVEHLILNLRQLDVALRLENEQLICDAPQGVMNQDLTEQVRRNKEAIIEFLKSEREPNNTQISIPVVARDIEIPLSFSQESLWFLEQLSPGTSTYNIPVRIRIAATIDAAILQRSLDEIVRRHEALRTRFQFVRGSPTQVIRPPSAVPLEVIDLSAKSPELRIEGVAQLSLAEATRPFRLDQDILLRATLLRLQTEEFVLLLTIHHIVTDASSVDLIFNELFVLYRAFAAETPSPLPEPRIQYADYSVWQRKYLNGEAIDRQLSYWKNQMANAPPVLELPIDFPRTGVRSFKGSVEATSISSQLTTRLKVLGRAGSASLFMTLLAAFQVLLYRCSGQSDIVVGSAISGRKLLELESMVGLFVNSLPLRLDLSGNPSFRQVLSQVREIVLEAYQNQDIPFEKLVQELRPPRDLSRNPLFQVFFSFRSRVGEDTSASISSEIISSETAKFDLSLTVEEFTHGMKAEIEYAELFRGERVIDLLKRLTLLLEGIAENADVRVDDIPLIDDQDRQLALVGSHQPDVQFDFGRFVDEVILAGDELKPDHEAMRFGPEVLSYKQLRNRVEEVALHLGTLGVRSNDLVGLCVERSLDLAVGLLGILKSGAAFVPLDPNFPKERLAYMVSDASPVAILMQKRTDDAIPPCAAARLYLDDLPRDNSESESSNALRKQRRPTDLAYVIYTSGSTGSPKGVEISHRSLMNFLYAMRQELGLTSKDTLLAVTTISFDIAMLELLLPLLVGGRVVLASQEQATNAAELSLLLREQSISVMQATPTTWRLLLAAQWTGDASLKILCGGEPWSEDLADALLSRCGSLWNMYGPTETTIWSAAKRISSGERVLIGPPIANTQFYVLGPNSEPQPIDMPGELYISGSGLARGYHRRPDLTAEKFVANPFGRRGHDHLYRTGDRVRRLPSGDFEFLGRQDSQVKIRGFRVEPDEIAVVLRLYAGITDAVVVVHGSDDFDKRLIAYCTGLDGGRPTDADLRSFLRSKLPNYMIPSSFEFLDRFPVTPNGKIDRKALERRVPTAGKASNVSIPPRSNLEKTIAKTWEKYLGFEGLGVSDDFFDLGAHSLMVVQVIHELNSSYGFRLEVSELFEHPTVAKLSAIIENEQREDRQRPTVVRLRDGGSGVPIYFIYAGPAEIALARAIGEDYPVFGIQLPWRLEWREAVSRNQTERFPTMDELAKLFVDALRSHLDSGTCVIAGYSFAGLLAFEVARRMLAGGDKVDAVIVIDKWLPYPSVSSVVAKNLKDCWTENRHEGVSRTLAQRSARSALVVSWVIKMLLKRLGFSALWLRPNELTAFLDEDGIPLRWHLVERLYIEIERHYRLEPLDCRGIVIRPEFLDRHGMIRAPDEYLGWRMLFKRGVKSFSVPGDHFSMVREHGRALAQVIGQATKNRLQAPGGSPHL
jgi:surfactin family lipopeptide synthetase A